MTFKNSFIPAMLLASSLLAGCGHDAGPATNASASEKTSAVPLANSDKGGAQLWAENCSRCHNIRPPQSFSSAQWQAIAMHMRLRADLTGPETRKITEFLQASH